MGSVVDHPHRQQGADALVRHQIIDVAADRDHAVTTLKAVAAAIGALVSSSNTAPVLRGIAAECAAFAATLENIDVANAGDDLIDQLNAIHARLMFSSWVFKMLAVEPGRSRLLPANGER
jgi:hypothetical protein